MTFHYLWYLQHLCHHILIHRTTLQTNAYVCTSTISERLRIDIKATTCDNSVLNETLHALVDGGARDVALRGYFLERHTRIEGQDTENFLV